MASLNEMLYDIRRIAEHREKLTEKKIKSIYRTLMKDLDSFVAEGYKKYADEEGRLYFANLDAHNKRAAFLQEVVKNVDGISPELQKEMMSVIEQTYKESYKGMVSAVKQADTARKFEEIVKDIEVNPKVLKQVFNNNISKLTLPAVMEKHRQELIYQIQQELNIGLMQGVRYENMAKRIQTVLEGDGLTKGARGKSMNIVRTEMHRNIESGFMDSAEEIQTKLDGSDLIYAATWRTMEDERVRPNYRYKTKKGWKSGRSTNGANHQIMEGVTVKAGELFDLKDGNKTKAPSQSGVAKHDCNCRCFLEYNLMTIEEFEEASGQKIKRQTGGKEVPIEKINRRNEEATRGYNDIKQADDIKEVAKASKMSEKEIEIIKNHIFFDKHIKYDGSVEPFDVDYDMAVAWKRLSSGTPEERDILLLKHELLESKVEKKFNLTAAEAHAKANEVYAWDERLLKECGEEGEADGLL